MDAAASVALNKLVSNKMWRFSSSGSETGRGPLLSDDGGILEGVSSLHSWIKKNTLIPPTEKMKKLRSLYDDVSIYSCLTFYGKG